MQYKPSGGFSTLCVLAGSKSSALRAAQIMKKLKSQCPSVQFMGLGGQEMIDSGLNKNYGDVSIFTDKAFFPQKYFRRVYIDQPIHPLMMPTHYQERKQRNLMKKNGFYRDVNYTAPDAFLCVGNEIFMQRVFNDIHTVYQQNRKTKPPLFFYDKLVINQENRFKDYYDHMFYTLPNKPVNWGQFRFPSTFVGKQSIYEGLKFLLSRHRPDLVNVQDNSIMLPTEYYMEIMEEMVQKERNTFRQKMGFADEHLLVFLGAGNTIEEVKFSIKVAQESIQELLKRPMMNNLPSNNVKLIVSVPKDLKWILDDHLGSTQSNNASQSLSKHSQNESSMFYDYQNPLIITEQEQMLSAMCGSDLSLCITGELSSTISALHLPLINLNFQPCHNSYFTSLYGQFENDINTASQNEIYSEKWCGWGGDAFGSSIAREMEEQIIQRKKRYQTIKRLDKVMKNMLPIVKNENQPSYSQNEVALRRTVEYQKCIEPDQLVADKLIEAMKQYQSVKETPLNRNTLLESLGHRVI